MPFTELLKEALSLNGAGIPAASHNGTTNTGAIDMSKFGRAMFIIDVGTLGASGTLDGSLYESDFPNTAAPNNQIANSALTQITVANRRATIEVNATQMTRRYLFLNTSNLVAASVYSACGLGAEPRDHPANTYDYAGSDSLVMQRVAVPTN